MQPAVFNLAMARAASTEDLAEEAHGRRWNATRLGLAGLGIAHLGEQESEVALLQLGRAVTGQVRIEVLPRRPERLARQCLLLAQPIGMRPAHLRQ